MDGALITVVTMKMLVLHAQVSTPVGYCTGKYSATHGLGFADAEGEFGMSVYLP